MKNLIIILIMLVITSCNTQYTEKINYTKVDSMSIGNRYSVSPEVDYTYWTDSGLVFSSKFKLAIGDSIVYKVLKIKR